jgi:malonate-semialdehyde dehydrogenase (acetylating)/methylmalonate-semialdehyde dehydrogenase
MDIVCPLT